MHCATMQSHVVSDGHIIADDSRVRFTGDVHNATILNIGSTANPDEVDIPTHDYVEPDARVFTNVDIAYHTCTSGNKNRIINLRRNAFVFENHSFSSSLSL